MSHAAVALRVGAALVVVAGLVSLTVAGIASFGGERGDGAKVYRLRPGQSIAMPAAGLFGREALIAVSEAPPPGLTFSDLACELTDSGGRSSPAKVSTLRAIGAGTVEVRGRRVTAVAAVRGFDRGWHLRCDGPAFATLQPAYLVVERGPRMPVGIAAAFGVVALVFGTGALLVLRGSRVGRRSLGGVSDE